jgi:hypothetical protein
MNRKLKMIFGATKIAVASQRYQPNRELTVAYLLTSEELPMNGWTMSAQQDYPTRAFNKGEAEIERAKSMKGTTSRRLFKNDSDSRSIFIEVIPLASATDAESWVASSDERVRRKMAKLCELNDFRVNGAVSIPKAVLTRSVAYSMSIPKGERTSIAVAANAEDVYVLVTCSDIDHNWPIDDVIEIVRVQINKILKLKGTSTL